MITETQWNELKKECPNIQGYETYLKRVGQIIPNKKKYTQNEIDNRISEATHKLQKLGVNQINRMTCLVFLALLQLTPQGVWNQITVCNTMTLSNGIMKFVSDNYGIAYKANTRESFRREGINVLLNSRIIDLNPDNPNLGPTSPMTHYAIRQEILDKIKSM